MQYPISDTHVLQPIDQRVRIYYCASVLRFEGYICTYNLLAFPARLFSRGMSGR